MPLILSSSPTPSRVRQSAGRATDAGDLTPEQWRGFVSTVYHRWVHSARARERWRRADHAAIFAAIAGTFSAM